MQPIKTPVQWSKSDIWYPPARAGVDPLLAFTGGTKRRPAIVRSGSNLIEAVPHQNFPGGH
jgi:hypothetical protein